MLHCPAVCSLRCCPGSVLCLVPFWLTSPGRSISMPWRPSPCLLRSAFSTISLFNHQLFVKVTLQVTQQQMVYSLDILEFSHTSSCWVCLMCNIFGQPWSEAAFSSIWRSPITRRSSLKAWFQRRQRTKWWISLVRYMSQCARHTHINEGPVNLVENCE